MRMLKSNHSRHSADHELPTDNPEHGVRGGDRIAIMRAIIRHRGDRAVVRLAPWGDVKSAHPWRNIIVHQTEGPAGSARGGAALQAKNPTRRGVMVWVETDGTVYWAVADNLVPTHTDGADRNDNKYIDNSKTYHQVNKDTSIGVEFAGNYPDVTRPATDAQIAAWRILVKVLRARYRIPLDHVYAHNWIDYKDARYCEGCALATLAREWGE